MNPGKNTLSDWLAQIEARHPRGAHGIALGLERVALVSRQLGQSIACPVITVAGTNGKGSVCAYLETVFARAGYRVACYTSPHLRRYNERIRIAGGPASDDAIVAAFERVETARLAAGGVSLTYFEFGTLAAWEVFAAQAVDVVILEVGLGGRLDAVNVYDPDVAVLTGIAIDHVEYLGNDREAIGREKAGIFRKGIPVVIGDDHPPQTVRAAADILGVDLRLVGRDFGFQRSPDNKAQWTYWVRRGEELLRRPMAYPGIRGGIQLANASVAATVVEVLRDRLPVGMQALRQGLIETELPGRFQVVPGQPQLVLDVAHNPQATQILAGNLGDMAFFPNTYAVVGMMRDKDLRAALAPLLGRIDHWCCASLPGPRGASAGELATVLRELGAAKVDEFDSVESAYDFASGKSGEADRIAAFGSFVTVAAILEQRDRRSACG